MPQPELRLRACAKVNLALFVGAARPDGYHPLESLVEPIELCDEITLRPAPQGDSVVTTGADLPTGADNLAMAALLLLRAHGAGAPPPCRIEIVKRIPVGGGLGGGSADAAAVLRGLNEWWGVGLSEDALVEIGLRLGADVPVCLVGRPRVMRGIGDRLTPAPEAPPHWLVLANPGEPAATGAVYRTFDRLPPSAPSGSLADVCAAYARGAWSDLAAAARNDLLAAALAVCPAIGEARAALLGAGAPHALLSGSGATVFALFADETAARKVHARLAGRVAFAWVGRAGRLL